MNALETIGLIIVSCSALIWGLLSAFLPFDKGGSFFEENMGKIVLTIFAIGTLLFIVGVSQS